MAKAQKAAQPDDKKTGAAAGAEAGKAGRKKLNRLWYEEGSREIIVYYLIAVFCLELVVGAIAFFYGVTNAAPLVEGGPRMARFPWVGWLVAAVLSPVGLLLLLHLSGQFFSRALNGGAAGDDSDEGGGGGSSAAVPERVQRVYSIVRHAPAIVILLGLVILGCAVLFLDSAMDVVLAMGSALRPYILWIIGGVILFLLLGYLGRLWFLARHRRMEQEYAFRMAVLEKTGIVIMNKGCVPMRYENGQLQLLAQNENGQLKALPQQESEGDASSAAEVEDATIIPDEKSPETGSGK